MYWKGYRTKFHKEVYNSIIGFVNFLIIMKVPTGIEKDELIRCKLVLENWSSNIYGCLVHLPAQAQKIKKHTKKGFLIIQKNGPFWTQIEKSYIFPKESCSYISGSNFLCTKNQNNLLWKHVLSFGKWNSLVPNLKNFLKFWMKIKNFTSFVCCERTFQI